jgi:hypothetical protein
MAQVNTERCRKKLLGDHYNYNGDVNGPRSGNSLSSNMETLIRLLCFFTSLLPFFSNIEHERVAGYCFFPNFLGILYPIPSIPRLHFPQ